ncbi:unnamed protein product [Ostreobium quekettii]|uniref:SFR19-like C-terminal domain-containing protein n=1 Tax=Ostreobium quekettii TaxID=121088 RepID=A0A8S1IV02_9CHLO|nr:unnamed protein product [Ostreobium quekettii]|eukprot:evm.model.scf_828EXC.5 EVM.evm.TU.scf_828EXC.5   scf_828EXC:30964-32836(-)
MRDSCMCPRMKCLVFGHVQIVKQDSVLRKAAIAAALAHEEELYAPASTKMAYLSAVAHARADESFIPGDCLHQVKATHCKQGTAPGKGIKWQDHADGPGRQQGSQHGRKRPRSPVPWAREDCDSAVAAAGAQLGGDRTETSVRLCFGSSSDSESESQEAGEPDDASQGQDAPPSSTISMPWKKREKWLEDAENNLSDGELHYTPPPRERSSRTAGERRKGEADDERQTCGPPLAGLPGSDILSRKDVRPDVIQCGRPTGGMDGLSHEQSEQAATPAGHCHRNPSMLPQGWESPDAEKSAAVREQVVRFVRGVLKPFFKASIVSKEMYKEVAKKSVDKVMGAHSRDSDASFLIHESERIRKLIEQYIEYCKFGKVQ